jgi:ATP-dependent protease Clp ATPase subunit
MKRAGSDSELRCSFCHKAQEVVGKLISSPSDYPRAYICDECIAVCNSIMEDDKPEPASEEPTREIQRIRHGLHLLVEKIPESDIPAVSKMLQGLVLR